MVPVVRVGLQQHLQAQQGDIPTSSVARHNVGRVGSPPWPSKLPVRDESKRATVSLHSCSTTPLACMRAHWHAYMQASQHTCRHPDLVDDSKHSSSRVTQTQTHLEQAPTEVLCLRRQQRLQQQLVPAHAPVQQQLPQRLQLVTCSQGCSGACRAQLGPQLPDERPQCTQLAEEWPCLHAQVKQACTERQHVVNRTAALLACITCAGHVQRQAKCVLNRTDNR